MTVLVSTSCLQSFDDSTPPLTVKAGADGLVRITELTPGDLCADGGRRIESGTDVDGDGVLANAEVTGTSVVCDGDDGEKGADGEDGANGATGPRGEQGATGSIASSQCEPGSVAVGVAESGALVCEPDGDTLAGLACASGEIPRREDGTWVCGVDLTAVPGTDTLQALAGSCAANEIARFNGIAWFCSTDVDTDTDTDTLAGLTCAAGDIARFDGASWRCDVDVDVDTDTLGALSCAAGEVARFDGASWRCDVDVDVDTDTLGALSCAAGEVARFDGAAWRCAIDADTDTLGALACVTGQIPRRQGTAWVCGTDIDTDTNTDTLAELTCVTGEIARFDGAGWSCDGDADTDTLAGLTCASGDVPHFSPPDGWLCEADADTLGALACAAGEVAKFQNGSWSCGADNVAAAGGGVFVKIVIVSPGASTTASGTNLRTALAAQTGAEQILLFVEPGVYDVGSTGVTVNPLVTLAGSGRDATTIRGSVNGAVMTVSSSAAVRDFTVSNIGPSTGARITTLSMQGAARAERLLVTASGSVTFAAGIRTNNAGVVLNGVEVAMTAATTPAGAAGIFVESGTASIRDCDVTVTNGASGTSTSAVLTVAGSTVEVAQGRLTSTSGANPRGLGVEGTLTMTDTTVSVTSTTASPAVGILSTGTTTLQNSRLKIASGGDIAGALFSQGATGAIVARDLDVQATSSSGVVFVLRGVGSMDVEQMKATATSPGGSVLIQTSFAGRSRVRFSQLEDLGAAVGASRGAQVLAGTLELDNVMIIQPTTAIAVEAVAGATVRAAAGRIHGTVSGAGTVTCTNVVDASFAPRSCP